MKGFYAASILCSWLGIACLLTSVYQLFAAKAALQPERTQRLKSALFDFVIGGGFFLLAAIIPHQASRGLSLPVFWPIMPFAAWAAFTFVVLALVEATNWAFLGSKKTPLYAIVWLMAASLFFWGFKASGDPLVFATGAIPLSIQGAVALAAFAVAALFAMAGTSNKLRLGGYARVLVTHLTLLVGCVVFGLPFFWLVITSLKEDRDMVSANGIIWVPKVQQTFSAMDTVPSIYATSFEGRAVKVEIMFKSPDSSARVNVVSPAGIQGLAFDTPLSKLHQVAVDAPEVTGKFKGLNVMGYVLEPFSDGRQKVKVLTPQGLKGQVFTDIPSNLEPLRKVGLRWENYSDALEYLPPEADNGLTYLKNTLLITILSVIGTILSSSLVAYAFSRIRFPGRDVLFGILLSTMMLPSAVTLLPKFIVFRQLGWIDTLYPLWAPAFFASAFNVFLLRQFFKNIPVELEDAAKIDGCNYLHSYWRVMMPQVKPALTVIGIWTFMGAWNDFMGPLIYINSPEKMTISYAAQLFAVDRATEPGLIMAFAAMSMVPVLLLFFFAQRYFIEGVTLTGFGGK
ncbi:MAG TPA: carbohydrate ABC transporter permease [Fimbriimonadaceae bacterium]